MAQVIKYLWTFPTTLLGAPLVLIALLTGGRARVVQGVLEAWGGLLEVLLRRCVPIRGGASAMTIGHIVVGRSELVLRITRAHERVHVRQAERWGPFFVPAYFAASLIAKMRGGNAYFDNVFERQAYDSTRIAPPDL
jgi:hypothetical protein